MRTALWEPCNLDEKQFVFKTITESSGETFDIDLLELYRSVQSPYEAYDFFKIYFHTQWTSHKTDKTRRFLINEGSHSYILFRKPTTRSNLPAFFALPGTSEYIHYVNRYLNFRVTDSNVINYVQFFGLAVQDNQRPFYFIKNIHEIPVDEGMPELSEKLTSAVKAMFGTDEQGEILLKKNKETYPLLGYAYHFRLPTIFSGHLFASEIRVSHAGFITMDDDEPTAIDSLNQYMAPSPYYRLDNDPCALQAIKEGKASIDRLPRMIVITQLTEKLFGFLSLPILFFNAIAIWTFGLNNNHLYNYFELIAQSRIISLICLLLGVILVSSSIIRFIFFTAAKYTSNLVPNILSSINNAISRTLKEINSKIGIIRFTLINAIEFIFIPFQGAILFSYGIINLFYDSKFNFIEATLMATSSVPGAPFFIEKLNSGNGKIGLYSTYNFEYISWSISFFFTTIIVGVFANLFYLLRKK